ncbi:MAG: O-antigen ligase family protein, partial [Polyangiaceae bacterium]
LNVGVGRALTIGANEGAIPAVFMLAVMYGAGTLERLRATMGLLLVLGLFVAAVAVHQGASSPVCMASPTDEDGVRAPDPSTADGRVCGLASDCTEDGRWDDAWACERVGLFGTFSVERRVRWRGQLNDPNELSVFIGAVLPLLIALGLPFRNAASSPRGPPAQKAMGFLSLVLVGLGLCAVIMTQSRGGQLVIATVFARTFMSRFGKKGIALAVVVALPVLLLGGRSDADADASATERTELLYQGVTLFFQNPIRGVGTDQFSDRVDHPSHLTAHNSYLLAAAELGLPGFFVWTGIAWTSLKIALTATRADSLSEELRVTGRALVASFSGIAVGIFFLSFTYKQLLFVWFGMAGAFYRVVREADPGLRVKIGWKDCGGIVLANMAFIALLWAYTRARGG